VVSKLPDLGLTVFILRGAGGVTAVAGGPEGLMVLELMVERHRKKQFNHEWTRIDTDTGWLMIESKS